jgi:hypothetical protein
MSNIRGLKLRHPTAPAAHMLCDKEWLTPSFDIMEVKKGVNRVAEQM